MNFLYIIGPPGSGKSTLVAELTVGRRRAEFDKPIRHIYWEGNEGQPVVELGGRRKNFSGTDTLALNVQPRAKAFVEAHGADLMIAEGDRLANDGFFDAVQGAGYKLDVVCLATPEEVAKGWRAARARALGTKQQDESWVRGRISKAEALAERWQAHQLQSLELRDRVEELKSVGGPVVEALFRLSE
jgi:energy-coupling factor transporter ATP-binding protein EcfA2